MNSFQLETICPDCGKKHSGVTMIEGDGELGSGFGVCFDCGAIFARVCDGENVATHSLAPAQLIKIAQEHPQMFMRLLIASTEIKKRTHINRKN